MARGNLRNASDDAVAAVRGFHRFWMGRIGPLREALAGTGFGPTEARVLSGVAAGEGIAAADLSRALDLDPAYLSRVLGAFERQGLLRRDRAGADRRRRALALTAAGRAAASDLDARAAAEVGAMLSALDPGGRDRLLAALAAVREALGDRAEPPASRVVLRRHRPGDIGWAVERHGTLYRQEHGWDGTFEALVAGILGGFAARHDPRRERAWIAEVDGRRAGCVFLVRGSPRVARLRCLLVEPGARGLGVGTRLVGVCVAFASRCGYRKVVLWTSEELRAARRLYEKAGFRLVSRKRERRFGKPLVFQEWEREL